LQRLYFTSRLHQQIISTKSDFFKEVWPEN
jgi:hypothetical protein